MTASTSAALALPDSAAVTGAEAVAAYRWMLLARITEERLASLYRSGRLVGGVYLGKGQEAYSAALGVQVQRGRDVLGTFIRDQAARLAWGESLLDCFRTYFGSVRGPMRGRDGNVHRGRPTEGLPAMISHIGSMVSLVSGMLYARRMQGRLGESIGAVTCGEGGTSTGAFHEGLNQAAVERLPLLIAVTNNQFSYSTPNDRQFACTNLMARAKGYGIDGHECDGTDVVDCLRVLKLAAARARAGHGPQLIVGTCLRLTGHGEHDDASYIPQSMKDSAVGRDCIEVAEERLTEEGWATGMDIQQWRREARASVEEAMAIASKEPAPDPFKENWRAISTGELAEGIWTA